MRRQVKAADVRRELKPGTSVELLKELHLLTRTGDLNADSLRKLKQVNHLAGLIAPALDDILSRFGEPLVVDCGAGKSALGFILYELFLGPAKKGRLLAVESRADLSRSGAERAKRLRFDRLEFLESPIADAPVPPRVHLVTALHACDTATDDAILLAVRHGADYLALVPCCQAEVARQLEDAPAADPLLRPLFEHPWHRREFGSHLTNVLRVLALEALGYKVVVTELTGWEHAVKNELILARKMRKESPAARARLDSLVLATGVRPRVLAALDPGLRTANGDEPPGSPSV